MTERKNITQPADWWAAFQSQAKAEGMTLSEWVGVCCVANIPQTRRMKLTNRPAAHRPRKQENNQ